jgi:hypothetical protein
MPPPAYTLQDYNFRGPLSLYPTLAALFQGRTSALRTHPPGSYRVVDFGRHASGEHDGSSDGYYYLLGQASGPCGWCWQHAISFFRVLDDDRNVGEFDLSGPIQTTVDTRFGLGDEIEVPQSFLAWSSLRMAQDPEHSSERICEGGRYRVQDVGTFESEGEMCLGQEDIELSLVDDIEDITQMPFYLLRNAVNGECWWTYEFLLLRAIAGRPADVVLQELRELCD